jgi:hypothetical protein
MPSPKKVTLVHKDLPDQPITVSARSVEIHKAAGWKLAPKTQQPDTA